MSLLVVVAIILIGVIVVQIARAGDLITVLKGRKEGEVSPETTMSLAYCMFGCMAIGLTASVVTTWMYKSKFLPPAASIHRLQLDSMFNLTLVFTGLVFIITHLLLFFFAFKYRYQSNKKAFYYPHNNKLEIV